MRSGNRARRPRRRRRRLLIALAVLVALGGALAGAVAARGPFFFVGCDLDGLTPKRLDRISYVYASDGSLLTTIGRQRRHDPLPLPRISPWAVKATVAAEDRRFYDHDGVDYLGVLRALVADVREREAVQGGSTITQQLVRTLYLGRERTLGRKLTEACLAVELERERSKDWILEAYLNEIYYGNRAYGIEAAARSYFSKPATRLTLEEAALLAALPQAPSEVDPVTDPAEGLRVRERVLRALLETGEIDEARFERVRRAPLGLQPSRAFAARESAVANLVLAQLVDEYGAAAVREGGFRVRTTIDGRLQKLARDAIRGTLDRRGDPAAALVAIDPENGAVRALASVVPGEPTYAFDLASRGRRQAGSAFKTFVLVEAISRAINPSATQYLSAPFEGPPSRGKPWDVETYDRTYVGRTTIADATLRSDNTVYARLTLDVGPERVVEQARAMGIRSELPAVPSAGLGTGTVSVLELASAYATLAARGVQARPLLVRKVTLPSGQTDGGAGWGEPRRERVLPDAVAYHVTRILERNIAVGTGTRAAIDRPAAGKTGTTDDYADAWFAGYTPDLAAAVWMGYPQAPRPMRDVHGIAVAGGTFPAQIWGAFMRRALEGVPPSGWPQPTDGIAWKRFCGRYQFARTFRDARPEAKCPEPRRRTTTTERRTTQTGRRPQATTTETAPPPATTATPPAPPPTQPPPPPPPAQPQPQPPPAQQLVGRRGFVTQDVDNAAQTGEVEIDGTLWPARSETGEVIPLDAEVEVVRVRSGILWVEPVPPPG